MKLEQFYIREYLLLVEVVHTTDICWSVRGLHQLAQHIVVAPMHSDNVSSHFEAVHSGSNFTLFKVYDCVTVKYSKSIRQISIIVTAKISFTNISFPLFLRDLIAAASWC